MNRRKFLVNTGIVGTGLLGAGNAASGLLQAGNVIQFGFKFQTGGKTRGIYRARIAFSF